MRNPLGGAVRSVLLSSVLVVGVVACGSDGDSGDASPDLDTATDEAGESGSASDDEAPGGESDGSASGEGTGTLTMADGTGYVFAMTTCETSNTDDFVLPDSYDLFGSTADGAFRFALIRAGLDEDFISHVGNLEGDFDEEGKNDQLLYVAQLDDTPLTVDGAVVSGSFVMRAIGPTRPHGDEIEAIVDVRC